MSTRPRRSALAATVLALLLLPAASCALGGGSEDNPFGGSGAGDRVELTVDNRNFKDATLYALWNEGGRSRIGRISGKTEETFEMELRGQRLRIEVDFLGGGGYTTLTQNVHPGDHLFLQVDPSA